MTTWEPADRLWSMRLGVALLGWAAAVAGLAAAGVFAALPVPIMAALVAAGTATPIALYYLHPGLRQFLRRVPLDWLTGFHVWRIGAALLFFQQGAAGLLPGSFVRNAGWGDLAVGVAALALLLVPRTRRRFLAFHLFGLADFILAVGTGLVFSLVPVPLMENIATLPIVLIPLFGVCVSGTSHVIAIDRLLRASGGERDAPL